MTNSSICASLALIATLTLTLSPEKTLIVYENVSEHIQSVRAVESQHFFFFKKHLTLQFSAPVSIHSGAQTSVVSVWVSVFWSSQPDVLIFLHFLFLFLSNPVSRTPPPPPPLTLWACVYVWASVCVCFGHNVTAPCPLCTRMGPLSVHVSMCVCFLYGELDSCGYCSLLTLSSWCQAELSKPSGKLNQKKLLLHASPSKYWKKGSSTCTDLKTLQKRMALQARLQGLA